MMIFRALASVGLALFVQSVAGQSVTAADAAAPRPTTATAAGAQTEGSGDGIPVITNDAAQARTVRDLPTIRNAPGAERSGTRPAVPRVPDASSSGRRAPSAEPRREQDFDPMRPGGSEAELPTEFQRFVRQAYGRALKLFGMEHFAANARGFVGLDGVPVPSDYLLGPGDELQIRAWGSVDIDFRAVVDRDGNVSVPRIGTVAVAGIRAAEIDGLMRTRIARVFRNFESNVSLGRLRSVQVFVVGHAAAPGSYSVGPMSTLFSVVATSGGPSHRGSLRRIQLRRSDRVIAEMDAYDFLLRGSRKGDIAVAPGDVIVYLPSGPRVAVLGAIDEPAVYELRADERVTDLLAMSGAQGAVTNQREAHLERMDPSSTTPRRVSRLSLPAESGQPLRDGDVLVLFAAEARYSNAVTLRGNVARPLRYPFVPGMRVSTLIPEPDALLTPDYFQRKNRQVQYDDSRTRGLTGLETDVRNIVEEPNWEYAVVERLDTATLALEIIPFNLGLAVLKRDPTHDLELRPDDVVTILSRRDIAGPSKRRTRLVRVEGEVNAPGIYQLRPGESLRDLLSRAGGVTAEAYLFGVQFEREETRKRQREALADAVRRLESQINSAAATAVANLGVGDAQSLALRRQASLDLQRAQLERLRRYEPSGRIALELAPTAKVIEELPEVVLEDGDRVLVPTRPSYVFAVGSVTNNNGLLWRPGRRLGEYLDVAGVEPDADEAATFVLRADGTALHPSRNSWFSSIAGAELMPGDTVVVPGKTDRETLWTLLTRNFKDWSQILYQLGLTAVALDSLRR